MGVAIVEGNPWSHSARAQDALWALLEAARAGSPEAAGRLLESFRPYLFRIANGEVSRSVRRGVAVSDVVQETFPEAHCGFPEFEGQSVDDLRGWLRRMLLHNLVDAIRRDEKDAKRRAHHDVSGVRLCLGTVSASDPTPRECAMVREEDASLRSALGQLRPDYRTVVELRYRQGLSLAEIAGRMDRSVDAARKLWLRAVKRLQQLLEQPAR
jgi:RNA polymerase sigma-70 factor, ECF subfamily